MGACVRVITWVLFGLLVPAAASAQSAELVERGTIFNLVELLDHDLSTSHACGEFFLFVRAADPNKGGIIAFVFDPESVEATVGTIEMWSDKIEVHITPKQKIPTTQIINRRGPTAELAIIEVSQEEFDRSPCLDFATVIRKH